MRNIEKNEEFNQVEVENVGDTLIVRMFDMFEVFVEGLSSQKKLSIRLSEDYR